MKRRNHHWLGAALVLFVLTPVTAQLAVPPDGPSPADWGELITSTEFNDDGTLDGVAEPLQRGPIHEAFAEPVRVADEEPFIVPQEPPAPIEELPPEIRPEDDGATWIPGYWSWDDDRKDYLWVSGVWRMPPHGRRWTGGFWEQVPGGFRWIAGSWVPEAGFEANRIPLPPPSLDRGPTSQPVSSDYFWVPGSWRYQETRYVWRPGFWSPCHSNWVWVPDYYVPTIDGCYYVPGYWDYGWEQRGMLFAPCYMNRVALRPGYQYRPSVAIDISGAFFHLWVRPSYSHYYFGDYYDNVYVGLGFTPWYSYHQRYRQAYDPLFVHYSWQFGRDRINFYNQMHHHYQYARGHADARPARRFDHRNATFNGPLPRAWQGDSGHAHSRNLAVSAMSQRHRLSSAQQRNELHRRVRNADELGAVRRSTSVTDITGPTRDRGRQDAAVTPNVLSNRSDNPFRGTRDGSVNNFDRGRNRGNVDAAVPNRRNPRAIPNDNSPQVTNNSQPANRNRVNPRGVPNQGVVPDALRRQTSKPATDGPAVSAGPPAGRRGGRDESGFGRRGSNVQSDAVVPQALRRGGASRIDSAPAPAAGPAVRNIQPTPQATPRSNQAPAVRPDALRRRGASRESIPAPSTRARLSSQANQFEGRFRGGVTGPANASRTVTPRAAARIEVPSPSAARSARSAAVRSAPPAARQAPARIAPAARTAPTRSAPTARSAPSRSAPTARSAPSRSAPAARPAARASAPSSGARRGTKAPR
ncbi:MAG: YXWGXW repeat-containing protein [Planctomycetales bacterium]|nr:YXWGXW repeat-containing protein [Planctomycetales bacterium]MCA9166588.1 YXWGXW repeat-containing protein [Planctomycetales bacterium]